MKGTWFYVQPDAENPVYCSRLGCSAAASYVYETAGWLTEFKACYLHTSYETPFSELLEGLE